MKHWAGLWAATILVATSAAAETPAADDIRAPTATQRGAEASPLDVELSGPSWTLVTPASTLPTLGAECRTDVGGRRAVQVGDVGQQVDDR